MIGLFCLCISLWKGILVSWIAETVLEGVAASRRCMMAMSLPVGQKTEEYTAQVTLYILIYFFK